jgi:hypothetical protein
LIEYGVANAPDDFHSRHATVRSNMNRKETVSGQVLSASLNWVFGALGVESRFLFERGTRG